MAKARPLGRRAPSDWRHYEKYPLTAATTPTTPTPVAIGVNWYEDFDTPVQKGSRYWIGLDAKKLGNVRGGHCVCLEPGDQLNGSGTVVRLLQDSQSWWDFYDQGREGACVGFGCSRMMSLLNRKRYDARWLWDWAKSTDEWPETNPGDDQGTSVRAACDILRSRGHVPWKRGLQGTQLQAARQGGARAPARASASTGGRRPSTRSTHPQEPRQRRRRRGAHPQLVGPRLPAPGVDARRDPAAADRRGRRGRAGHGPPRSRARSATPPSRPASAPDRHVAAPPAWKGSAGTSPTWWNGERSSATPARRAAPPTSSQRNATLDEPVGDRRRSRAAATRERERAEGEEEERRGQAVRARLEHAGQRRRRRPARPRPPRRARRPASAERRGAARPRAASRPASQRAPADREREQRLEPLLGLLARARRRPAQQREEADREHEEEEVEAEEPDGRRAATPPPSFASCSRRLCRESRTEKLSERTPMIEREHADADQPARAGRRARRAAPARSASDEQAQARRGALSWAASRPAPTSRRSAIAPREREQQHGRRQRGAGGRPAARRRTGAAPRPSRAASPSAASPAPSTVSATTRSERTRGRARRRRCRARGGASARAGSRARRRRRRPARGETTASAR